MTHSVHPYSHRLGIIRDWRSRWFGKRGQYQQFLKMDILLREFLTKRLRGMYVDSVDMERSVNTYRIIIRTSRPGMIIGRNGEGAAKLKNDIIKIVKRIGSELPKELKVDIEEVKNPDARAAIVAAMVAEGLEKRLPFRRVLKQTVEKVMGQREVKGVKIALSGRLGGADMSRAESLKQGQIPLQTLRADIDFAREQAYLSYGVIGIKVWIYRGEIFADK
ncbi:MAG: 30S ribosomal protein S3 [Candidatus Vogelbacteria bacterium]|nr:30S ribosomal protein S3 [Candidatus Vogelbacteria bacterium]